MIFTRPLRSLSVFVILVFVTLSTVLQASASATAYGGSFGDAFKGSFINSVVALGLADAQTGIGGIFEGGKNGGEGSLGHVLLHGLAGCVAAEAQGADCAAGAAGGIAGAIYSGMQKAPERGSYASDAAYQAAFASWKTDVLAKGELVSLGAAWIASGGKAENVGAANLVSNSAIANNYLYHEEAALRARSRQELEACTSAPDSCSDQRIKELMGTIAALDSVDAARDLEYRNACTNDGTLACLAARRRYIDAQASFIEANRTLGDQGDLAEYGDIFADIQAEFQSGLATDRLAVEAGIQRGIDFTARNLEALGSGAAGGAVVATAYFGGAALAGCLANPVCRTEVSVAIAEAAAGDALGGATLVPVVVAGRVALTQGDTVVGFIDEATHTFSRSADVPYDPRAVREGIVAQQRLEV
ncbi:MAG: hypothetical protein PHX82_16990 [Paracoccaceae bacterium]|nr:hypothetical protein [Paracoccaceae bacterium]